MSKTWGFFLVAENMVLSHRAKFQLILNFFLDCMYFVAFLPDYIGLCYFVSGGLKFKVRNSGFEVSNSKRICNRLRIRISNGHLDFTQWTVLVHLLLLVQV